MSLSFTAICFLYLRPAFFFRRFDDDFRVAEGAPPGACWFGRAGSFPRPICFIIFSICLRAASRLFTCSTVVPEPRAMRSRRFPSITIGLPRSKRRHREHDRLDPPELLVVDVDVAELLAQARDHLQDTFQRTHPPQHLVRLQEVVERELTGAQLAFHLRLIVFLDSGLRPLDQRQHVAHAEDPRCHAVGVEDLERVELLARSRRT